MRSTLTVMVLLGLGMGLLQAQSKVATTAAQFLGIPVGPRAIAMGSAYVASHEDVTSICLNEASGIPCNRGHIFM